MTKPTDEQIEGALIYVGKMRKWAIEEEDNNHLHTIRTSLEEYGRPKTVTREFITMLERIAEDCIIGDEEGFIDSMEFLSRTMGLLQQAGIEITGTSPDNISKEVNNGS